MDFVKIVCWWGILCERFSVIFVIALYFGCTTSQRSIQFGYLPHPLVWGHRGPLLRFLESSQLKKLMAWEAEVFGDNHS